MANGIFVAASGAMGQLRQLEVLANNLSHANTPGFKSDEVTFREVIADETSRGRGPDDTRYVQLEATKVRREQGEVQRTGNDLDVALTGNAYLKVRSSRGEHLTRNGRMIIGGDGSLRTIEGHQVLDRSGRGIRIPQTSAIRIDDRGTLTTAEGTEVGRLGVQGVDSKAELRKQGEGLFQPVAEAPLTSESQVIQGFIESSNAQPVRSMIHLIEVQRAFSALQQAISTYQEVDRNAVSLARQGS